MIDFSITIGFCTPQLLCTVEGIKLYEFCVQDENLAMNFLTFFLHNYNYTGRLGSVKFLVNALKNILLK